MPTLNSKYNWGSAIRNANPELVNQLDNAYTDTAQIVNTKISRYRTDVNPPNNVTSSLVNKNFDIGDIWINTTSNTAWIMTSRTSSLVVNWQQIT